MTSLHSPRALLDMNSCISFSERGVLWQSGRWRYHQDFELHAIMAPFDRAFVGDEVHRLAPGSVVLVGPRLPHNFRFVDGSESHASAPSPMLQFAAAPLRESMDLLPDLREAEALLDRAHLGIEFFGFRDLAMKHLLRVRDLRGLGRFSAFAALLYELARWQDARTLTSLNHRQGSATDDIRSGKIYTVLDYLRANYMQQLSLAGVSTMAGMPEAAFCRQFRKITGSTFTTFVTELRIAKACQLLLHTQRQISGICYDVGFNNISNFNRHFLKRKGVTPGGYRALAKCGTNARGYREDQGDSVGL